MIFLNSNLWNCFQLLTASLATRGTAANQRSTYVSAGLGLGQPISQHLITCLVKRYLDLVKRLQPYITFALWKGTAFRCSSALAGQSFPKAIVMSDVDTLRIKDSAASPWHPAHLCQVTVYERGISYSASSRRCWLSSVGLREWLDTPFFHCNTESAHKRKLMPLNIMLLQ